MTLQFSCYKRNAPEHCINQSSEGYIIVRAQLLHIHGYIFMAE